MIGSVLRAIFLPGPIQFLSPPICDRMGALQRVAASSWSSLLSLMGEGGGCDEQPITRLDMLCGNRAAQQTVTARTKVCTFYSHMSIPTLSYRMDLQHTSGRQQRVEDQGVPKVCHIVS
jgi:hypothetical protein